MIKLAKIIATFFGLGLFPLAPGTLASLVIVLIYKYYLYGLARPIYLLILILVSAVGTFSSTIYARSLNLKDPGKIVIDEVAGQMLALFLIKPDWIYLGAIFLIFRFFDIIKPMGVKKLETLPWGWGIMADDLASGLIVNLLAQTTLLLFKV